MTYSVGRHVEWFLVFVLCTGAYAARAQAPTGRIHGTVTDVDNGGVVGAPIELRNTRTGALHRTRSGQDGKCVIKGLGCGIGRYLLVLGFQFWMTVMGEALASSGTELITKDWPSGATM